jgi:hypothetical protein
VQLGPCRGRLLQGQRGHAQESIRRGPYDVRELVIGGAGEVDAEVSVVEHLGAGQGGAQQLNVHTYRVHVRQPGLQVDHRTPDRRAQPWPAVYPELFAVTFDTRIV